MAKRPAATNKTRDWLMTLTGIFMLLYQMITWHINYLLVAAALTLLGIPGGIGLFQLARGSDVTRDTHGQPSEPQQSSSQSQ